MRYYNNVREVNRKVDKICQNLIENGGEVDLNISVLNLTNDHAVGEKMIEKRFKRWVDSYQDFIFLDGNLIKSYSSKSKKK